jgi:hypothetical protein
MSRFGSVTMCERLDAIVLCHIVISWMRWNKPFYLRVQPPRVIEQFNWANELGAIVSHQWFQKNPAYERLKLVKNASYAIDPKITL